MATGFFCIDKPEGITSHDVVSRMRKILNMRKVGHSGTLDPMATGVLIVGCGPSTRLLDYVQAGVKEYVADVRFGIKTSTGDAQGETVEEYEMGSLTREELEKAIESFVGTISQIPPMVSAIKVDGKKLYEYEREGVVIDREPRETVIESISIEEFSPSVNDSYPEARIRVRCHAGTYIRTLAEDIAISLDGGAYLFTLRRTSNGTIRDDQCVSLETLGASENPFEHMIEPLQALSHLPHISLDDEQTLAVSHGKTLTLDSTQKSVVENTPGEFVVVSGSQPRELVAIYPAHVDQPEDFRSRCVVFLDETTS